MSEENKNLELWRSVEKTDPNHTKKANVGGNKITAIAPQYQILNATREFGVYGVTWGFKSLEHRFDLADKFNIIILNAVFFFPNGEFPITSSIKIYRDNAMTKVDSDFAKKLETDTLTKALSKLGFNADVFMGRYDDVKYMEEVTKEFAPKQPTPTKDEIIKLIGEAKTKSDLTRIKPWVLHYGLMEIAKTKSKIIG